MKIKKFVVVFLALFSLSACNFQSREDFQKEINEEKSEDTADFTMPKITYVSDKDTNAESPALKEEEKNKNEKLDFNKMYGTANMGKNVDPKTNHGNLKDLTLGDTQIGISLVPSIQSRGGYSTLLSYKRNGELVEREFGPVGGMSGVNTYVRYDKVEAESGPMLLVSQVSVINNQTYSAYYLFNRFMSLMDYLVFKNSTDNINPTVERLGDVVEYTDQAQPGSLEEALSHRKEAEDRHLDSMLSVYGIKKNEVSALVDGKEVSVGYLPEISGGNRILYVKTTDSTENSGMNIDIE